MADWYKYFDGSEFYSKRNTYRNQLLQSAIAVINEYNLKTFIYDTSGTYTLTDDEYDYLLANYDSYEAKLQEKYQPTLGEFSLSGRIVSWTRYGVQRYTNIRGEQKARLETNYIMDQIDPVTVAGWIASLALGLATSWLGTGWVLITGVIVSITSAISSAVFYIYELILQTENTALNATILTESIVGAYVSSANEYMASKSLSAGELMIWKGYEIYAGGTLYKAQSAGNNNSYTPTKAYNPAERFSPIAKIKEPMELTADYTQGRNHYSLGGNDGFMKQIAPNLVLAKINDLDPDLDFKLNSYKTNHEQILRGYSELAQYIGSDDDNDASEWIQSWYSYENENYKNIYYTYAQSKNVINLLKYYPKALRAELDFYSRWQDERNAEESTSEVTQDNSTMVVTEPSDEDFNDIYEMDYSGMLDLWLQSQIIESQEEYQYYDTESKEFLEFKLAFFESLDLNYLINACILDGVVSGYLVDGASDSEYLEFYTSYISDSYKAYILAMVSGLSLSFESSVCKDALGYYFGLFSSEYDADLVLGMDAEEFLNEPYDSHSKVDLGSYSFSLSISTFNGINGTSYSGTLSYDSWGLWGVVEIKNYSIVGYKISSFTLSAELIEKYFDGSDSFTISTEDLGLPYATYIKGLYFKNEMDWYWEDVVRLESVTFSLKNKAQIDSVESNSFSDFSYSTSARGWIEVNEGNEPYFEAYSTFSGNACKANVTWSINSYYDSEDIYSKASSWLESAKAEVQALIKTAKTQAEIESAIAEALEAELEAQATESESMQAKAQSESSESQSESSAQATQSTQANS